MTPALGLGLGLAAAAIAAAAIATAGRAWWLARARVDPRLDPAARWVSDRHRASLDALLASGGGDPTSVVEQGLAICAVDERLSWRAGLHRLEEAARALPRGDDADALRAELALALGRIDEARSALRALPADHWRACAVRARLYDIDGDIVRAVAALVAARQLAPGLRRPELTRRLEALRARHRKTASEFERLWERPPD